MNHLKQLLVTMSLACGLPVAASAAIITVNTANNTDFGAGKTNLWLALQVANTNGASANTIVFNIAGSGPHYLVTPPFYAPGGIPTVGGGYPIITNHNLTIDGYSQPGAFANTNGILGSNTAKIKIVIDSRASNYTPDANHPLAVGAETMDFAAITGKFYEDTTYGWRAFTSADAAQLCIFHATNVSIKGLCFLNDYLPGENGLSVASIALGADYPTNWANPPLNGPSSWFYPDYALHVSGCWFNLMPDGTTVVDGGYNAVRIQRQRMASNQGDFAGRWSPSGTTIGVAKTSANPRAEFNIIMSQLQGTAIQGERSRYSGNFFNVLADGMTQYFPDPQTTVGDPPAAHPVPTTAFIGGSYAGRDVIGTDGDGVNDAEERNIFAGLPRKRSNGCAQIDHQAGCWNLKISGNYFGVAVDGVTRWTNSTSPIRVSNRPTCPTNCVFGSDFDGVSDAIEANVMCNNWPLDYWFPNRASEPDITLYFNHQLSPRYQPGAPPETLNSDKQGENSEGTGYQFANAFRGNKLINNFTGPISPFACWRDASSAPGYFPYYTNVIAFSPFSFGNGTAEEGATNFVTVLDPSSSTARLRGSFPLGTAPYTDVIIDVYVANEEGLTNGAKFQTLTNVLPVWSQGERVLAYNLLADGPSDLNATPGAFEFDVSSYNIPAGTKVTVTASYAKPGVVGTYMAEMHTSRFALPVALVQGPTPITINSIINDGNGAVTIHWTGGVAPYVLETRASLASGNWSPIQTNANASATVTMTNQAFFRVK